MRPQAMAIIVLLALPAAAGCFGPGPQDVPQVAPRGADLTPGETLRREVVIEPGTEEVRVDARVENLADEPARVEVRATGPFGMNGTQTFEVPPGSTRNVNLSIDRADVREATGVAPPPLPFPVPVTAEVETDRPVRLDVQTQAVG